MPGGRCSRCDQLVREAGRRQFWRDTRNGEQQGNGEHHMANGHARIVRRYEPTYIRQMADVRVRAIYQSQVMVENERTGERVDFVVESADLLRMEVTWSRPGLRSVRHAHPGMEERWTVLEGRAAFEIDGVLAETGPGSLIIAPAGRPHLAWNPTDEPVRLLIEMRPALRWAEFVRRYFSGQEDVIRLLEEFDREIVLAPIIS
jgi:quercetin dioxygenase-like cupin family protein